MITEAQRAILERHDIPVPDAAADVHLRDGWEFGEFFVADNETGATLATVAGWTRGAFGIAFCRWAAYEAERTWGVPASILLRLRNRDVKDMLLSNWLAVKVAYEVACQQVKNAADHQEFLAREAGRNETTSTIAKAASLVAGPKDGAPQ